MEKVDYKKELKEFYKPSGKKFSIVDVPEMQFIMIDGHGNPNGEIFGDCVEALYGISYTLKFANKEVEGTPDYTVMPLQALWWSKNMEDFANGNKDNWEWTVMIMTPDFITNEQFEAAREALRKKKDVKMIDNSRLEKYTEGTSVQILYTGPYADEAPTIKAMHEHAEEAGYKLCGKHHEIYLSDPRKTAPEKLKTVIRQPITK